MDVSEGGMVVAVGEDGLVTVEVGMAVLVFKGVEVGRVGVAAAIIWVDVAAAVVIVGTGFPAQLIKK